MIKRSWVRKLPSDGRKSRAPVIISTIEWARAVRLLWVWWLLGVAEVGSLFPRFRASIWESCRHKAHRTVTERAWFACQKCKKLSFLEHDTVARVECHVKNAKKMRGSEQPQKVCIIDAARMLADLVQCSCYVGLQPGFTKRGGMAARSKALVMLRRCWHAGLHLKILKAAKRLETAAGKVGLGLSATLVLCSIAAGGC